MAENDAFENNLSKLTEQVNKLVAALASATKENTESFSAMKKEIDKCTDELKSMKAAAGGSNSSLEGLSGKLNEVSKKFNDIISGDKNNNNVLREIANSATEQGTEIGNLLSNSNEANELSRRILGVGQEQAERGRRSEAAAAETLREGKKSGGAGSEELGTAGAAGTGAKAVEGGEDSEKKSTFERIMTGAKEGAKALLLVASSLVVLAIGLKMMETVDPETLKISGIALITLGTGLYFLAKLPAENLKRASQGMVLVAASLSVLAIGIMLFKEIKEDEMLKAGIAISAIFFMLSSLAQLPADNLKQASMGMLMVAASLPVLAIGLKLIATVPWDAMGKAAVALLGLIVVFKAFSAMNKQDKDLKQTAIGMILLASALIPLAAGLFLMGMIEWETLGKAAAALAGLVGIGYLMGKYAQQFKEGAKALAFLGLALLPITGVLFLFNLIEWETMGKAAAALVGLAVAGAVIGKNSATMIEGAIAIAALGASLLPLTFAMMLFSTVSWETLATAGVALLAFAAAAAGLSFALPFILGGALAIGALGVALMLFAGAMRMMVDINEKQVNDMIITIGKFAAYAAGIGLAAPLIILGSVAIGILGVALIAFGVALTLLTPALEVFGEIVRNVMTNATPVMETFGKVIQIIGEQIRETIGVIPPLLDKFMEFGLVGSQIGGGLIAAAAGITALGAAILAFTGMSATSQVAGAVGGVISGIAGFFTGSKSLSGTDMLTMFMAFAEMAPRLNEGAAAINNLAAALQNFAKVKFDNTEGLDMMGKIMDKANSGKGKGGALEAMEAGMSQVTSLFGFGGGEKPASPTENVLVEIREQLKMMNAKTGSVASTVINNAPMINNVSNGGGGGGAPIILAPNPVRHADPTRALIDH